MQRGSKDFVILPSQVCISPGSTSRELAVPLHLAAFPRTIGAAQAGEVQFRIPTTNALLDSVPVHQLSPQPPLR